jgi:hypothetical protein
VSRSGWTEARPCPICGHSGWCSVSADGGVVSCRRREDGCASSRVDRNGTPYFLHVADGARLRGIRRDPGPPRADPDHLDLAYRAVLGKFGLTKAHRRNLRDRGLTDEEIERRQYRSLTRADLRRRYPFADEPEGVAFQKFPPKHLTAKELLTKVPGFVCTRDHFVLAGPTGLLIPVRDDRRRIVALKVRVDEPRDTRRYFWLSSTKHDGPGPGSPPHWPLWPGGCL